MVCRKCGKTVADSDLFCTHCGTVLVSFESEKKITEEAAPVPTGTAEPVKPSPTGEVSGPAPSPVIVLSGKKEPVLKAQTEKNTASDSEFVWNVYDFPKPQNSKTEDIRFSWDTSALELTKAQEAEKKMEEELFGELDAKLREQEEAAKPAAFEEKDTPALPRETFPDEESVSLLPEDPFPDSGEESSPISDALFRELFGDKAFLDSLADEAWEEEIGGEPLSQPEADSSPASVGAEEWASPSLPLEGKVSPQVTDEVEKEPQEWGKDIFAELPLPPEAEGPEKHPERFFTFTQKNEEFQKLLDREYERMQNFSSRAVPLAPQETRGYPPRGMHRTTPQSAVPAAPFEQSLPLEGKGDRAAVDEVEIPTPAPAIVFKDTAPLPNIPESLKTPEAPAPQPEVFEDPKDRPEVPSVPGGFSGIGAAAAVSPTAQAMTRSSGRDKKVPFTPTPEEAKTIFLEVHEEKFRASMWNDDDYEEDRPRRPVGKYIGRVIVAVIILFLVLEVASLAILFFAPDSKGAPLAEKFQEKTLGLVLDIKDSLEGSEDSQQ